MSNYGRFRPLLLWSKGKYSSLLSSGQHDEPSFNSVMKRKSEHPDLVKLINT